MSSLNILVESFVIVTKLSVEAVLRLDRWYSQQNLSIKIEIFVEQKNQFFKYSKLIPNKEIVPLVAFYMAIKHYFDLECLHSKKNKSMCLKDLDKNSDFTIKSFKRQKRKVKREKLLNLWSVVQKLKIEEFSFREISNFIKSKHRFEVSHTYVAKIWKELEHGN